MGFLQEVVDRLQVDFVASELREWEEEEERGVETGRLKDETKYKSNHKNIQERCKHIYKQHLMCH